MLITFIKVIIFDPNWSMPPLLAFTKPSLIVHPITIDPAHDLQAMDRAYRFGQRRDVSVYRLLGAGSLEELSEHPGRIVMYGY